MTTPFRIVHQRWCDYADQIVGQEDPLRVVTERDRWTDRDGYCSCDANPRLKRRTVPMLRGLNTITWQKPDVLSQLRAWGWDMVRLDVQQGVSVAQAVEWITDARDAGFADVQIIVRDISMIAAIRAAGVTSLRISAPNEPDLASMANLDVKAYALWLRRAWPCCQAAGFGLDAPVVSGLHTRGFAFLQSLWTILLCQPEFHDVRIDVHCYDGWNNIPKLLGIIGARPWGISEFGYQTGPTVSEAQQATLIKDRFAFLAKIPTLQYAVLYQLNRSATDLFGILDESNGQTRFLPAARIFVDPPPPPPDPPPNPDEPPEVLVPGVSLADARPTAVAGEILNARFGGLWKGLERRAVNAQGGDETFRLVPLGGDRYALLSPNGREWVSVQPDGSLQGRSAAGAPGSWETFTLAGQILSEAPKGDDRPAVQFLLTTGATASVVMPRESGFIRARGTTFVDEQDRPWAMKAFAIHCWLNPLVDSEAAFQAMLDVPQALGYNTILGHTLHASPWKYQNHLQLNPVDRPDFFDLLARGYDICAGRGLRVANGCWADAQYLPSTFDRQAHWRTWCDVTRGRWNLFARKGNEPGVNGWDHRDYTFPDMGGVLCSQGQAGIGTPSLFPYLHWVEYAPTREPHAWLKDSGFGMRQIHSGDTGGWPGVPVPLVNTEPQFFADTNPDDVGDHRLTDPKQALDLALAIFSNCEGGAFGGSRSLEGKPMRERERQCAEQFIRGATHGFQR
jgi:hypothetical protein